MTDHMCTGSGTHPCSCEIGRDHSDREHVTAIQERGAREMTAQTNAAEIVRVAIQKLEEDLRDSVWTYDAATKTIQDGVGILVASRVAPPDARRILRGQRATLAQLAVLRAAAQHIDHNRAAVSHSGPGIELARAILGEQVPA